MNEIYENTVYQVVAAGSRGQSAYGGRLVAKVLGWILSIEHESYMFMRYYKGIITNIFRDGFCLQSQSSLHTQ